jgi:hypothetical protein
VKLTKLYPSALALKIFLYSISFVTASNAFHLLCHPSLVPDLFYLYSYKKFALITTLLAVTGLSLFFAQKNKSSQKSPSDFAKDNSHRFAKSKFNNPISYSIIVLLLAYVFSINTGFSVGIDFATQLKATLQWNEGLTNKWNHLVQTDFNSLEKDSEIWLVRPPGAFIYYIAFISLPLPLGESLRLAQLLLSIIICCCWIKTASILMLDHYLKLFLGIILAFWTASHISNAGNVQLLVTAYSALTTFLTVKVASNPKVYKTFTRTNLILLALLCLGMGAIVFLKISAIIFHSLLFSFLFIIFFIRNKLKFNKVLIAVISFIIFCIPYLILGHLNSENGIIANDIYNQDYNNQWIVQKLWGDFFAETTQFPAILLSFLASFSTFSPFHFTQTLFSNFLTYTGWLDSIILSINLNPKVIYKGFVGLIFSLIFITFFLKYSNINKRLKFMSLFILVIPFLIFTYLSNKHGYNYLITGTYIDQFIPIFCLIILIITFNYYIKSRKFSSLIFIVLFFSLGLFTYSNISGYLNMIISNFSNNNCTTSHISHPFFGKDMKMVEKVIYEKRKSEIIPIVYLGNSSTEELSITFPGRYSGISNVSKLINDPSFTFSDSENEAIVVIDSRLKAKDLALINLIFVNIKHSLLLDVSGTSKVFHING